MFEISGFMSTNHYVEYDKSSRRLVCWWEKVIIFISLNGPSLGPKAGLNSSAIDKEPVLRLLAMTGIRIQAPNMESGFGQKRWQKSGWSRQNYRIRTDIIVYPDPQIRIITSTFDFCFPLVQYIIHLFSFNFVFPRFVVIVLEAVILQKYLTILSVCSFSQNLPIAPWWNLYKNNTTLSMNKHKKIWKKIPE